MAHIVMASKGKSREKKGTFRVTKRIKSADVALLKVLGNRTKSSSKSEGRNPLTPLLFRFKTINTFNFLTAFDERGISIGVTVGRSDSSWLREQVRIRVSKHLGKLLDVVLEEFREQ